MYRNLYILLLLSVLTASCKDESLDKSVVWHKRICGNDMIGDPGIGYPVYNNTVVFHSTPLPINGYYQSILHGLDTETGKEKWTLTNKDFLPKKNLQFASYNYYYQCDNIVVLCDRVSELTDERYIYAIDIETGKVLWVKELPSGYTEMGRLVRGMGKLAYVDAINRNTSKFSLFKINIETGEFSAIINLTNIDLPTSITNRGTVISACNFSDIYKNNKGDELIACSINSWQPDKRDRWFMALYVYNLSAQQKVYSIPVSCSDTLKDSFFGRVCYHDGKIIVGKGAEFLCFDAFEDKNILWQNNTGKLGNDNAMQVFGYDNLALGFTVDRLFCYDINTGDEYYNIKAAGSNTANVIDGIIYQRDGSDFQMRDPKTGKELKRIVTGRNEQAFSSSRPNGANGRIYVHTYTDAYCIKAWGK
jgi:outer membrane protein assembly factor BamB